MALILRRCVLTAGLLVALFSTNLWGKDRPTIRVAAFNYYPAIFLDTDNEVRGFYVDMLDEIASREQIRFEYVFGTWNEGLERLRTGDIDLIPSAAYTPERATYMDFGTQVLLTVWGELYVHQDSPTLAISDLQDKHIAVMRGDHNARIFRDHLAKFGISGQFIEFADFDEVFEAVQTKQVIGGVVNSVFGDAAAKKYDVHSSGIAFNPFDNYFAAAKGQHFDLLTLLDYYLFDWRNDDTSVYYQARLKWGGVQEPEEIIPAWVVRLAGVAVLLLGIGLVFIVLLRYRVHTATRQLKENEERLRVALNSAPMVLFNQDIGLRYTWIHNPNPGFKMEQVVGRTDSDLLPGQEAVFLMALKQQVLESGRGVRQNVLTTIESNTFVYDLTIEPLRDETGAIVGITCASVDITELKRAEEALQQKNVELEHFVYSVSHDLTSPLVTVNTFVDLLRHNLQGLNQPNIIKNLNYIEKAADKMQQLINALLEYSRIGRIDPSAQNLSASQSVEDCLTTLAGILQRHEVQLSTSEMAQQLHGDPIHFGQIWQNLIENAIKYRGDQSKLQIEIGVKQQGHEIVFYVRDNGMGIEPKHSERIFNLFSQLNPGSEGSGLGLALVKKIVSIYKGRIWVESSGKGNGSCFLFTLPGALIKVSTKA